MIPLYLIIYQEGNRMYLIKSCQCVPCLTLVISLIRRIPKAIKTMLSPGGCGMKTSFPVFLQPRYLKGENVTIRAGQWVPYRGTVSFGASKLGSDFSTSCQKPGTLCWALLWRVVCSWLDCSHSSFFQMWLHILPARWVDSSLRRTPVTHKMPSKALAHSGSL